MKMPKPPKDYEYTGEFRRPEDGELWLTSDGDVKRGKDVFNDWPILRKKTKGKWKPERGDLYWWVAEINHFPSVDCCVFANDEMDAESVELGNCFKTEEEAEQMLDEILKLLKKGL